MKNDDFVVCGYGIESTCNQQIKLPDFIQLLFICFISLALFTFIIS